MLLVDAWVRLLTSHGGRERSGELRSGEPLDLEILERQGGLRRALGNSPI